MPSFLFRHEDYVIENTSSKWRHKKFAFSSPSLSKILVALLILTYVYIVFLSENVSSFGHLVTYKLINTFISCYLIIYVIILKSKLSFNLQHSKQEG